MRLFVIVNPCASGGKASQHWVQIHKDLEKAFGSFEFEKTKMAGDATIICKRAVASGHNVIAVVGGDGTVNEALNGLVDRQGRFAHQVKLAIFPCGTGSDFSKSANLNNTHHGVIDAIESDAEHFADVGKAEFADANGRPCTRYFLNIASLGLSGLVGQNINQTKRSGILPTRLVYLTGTLRALLRYQAPLVRIKVDGDVLEMEMMLAAVANGRYFGGGMLIAPEAILDDGQLNLVCVEKTSKLRLATNIIRVYRGHHLELSEVSSRKGKKIRIELADKRDGRIHPLDLDGESPGILDCEFSVLPSAVRIAR